MPCWQLDKQFFMPFLFLFEKFPKIMFLFSLALILIIMFPSHFVIDRDLTFLNQIQPQKLFVAFHWTLATLNSDS